MSHPDQTPHVARRTRPGRGLSPAEVRRRLAFAPRRAVTWEEDVTFERYDLGPGTATVDAESHTRVMVQLRHTGPVRWGWAGRENEACSILKPSLAIVPAGTDHFSEWDGRSRSLHLLLPDSALVDAAGRRVRLRPVFDGSDPTLLTLMRLLAGQADDAEPDLMTRAHLVRAAVAYLLRHYHEPADRPSADAAATALSGPARRRVADYLVGGVRGGDRPMTAAAVARVAGVSTRQLSRQFRATFGVTLPRFVMQARAEYALELIRTRPHAGRAAVAAAAGFSDQAHLSRTLKRLGHR